MRIKFVQDVNWLVISAVLVGAGGIVLQSIVANTLGIAALGMYALVIATYNVIASGCTIGMDVIVLRIAAVYSKATDSYADECERELKHKIGNALVMVAISSIGISIAAIVFLIWWPLLIGSQEIDKIYFYLFPTIALFSVNKVFVSVLMGLRRAFLFAMIRLARIVLLVVLTGIAIQFDKISVFHLLLAYPITEAMLCLYLLIRLRRDSLIAFSVLLPFQWTYWKEGAIISISTLLSEAGKHLPLLIAAYILSLEEAGEVAYLLAFSQVMLLVSTSISNNVNPIIASRWSNDHRSELEGEMRRIYRVTILSAPLLLAGSIVAYLAVTYLIMPERYSEIVYLFVAFSIASSLRHALGWPGFMLILVGKSGLNASRLACTFCLSLTMLLFAALQWGVIGLGISAIFVAAMQMLLLNTFVEIGTGVKLFNLAKRAILTRSSLE